MSRPTPVRWMSLLAGLVFATATLTAFADPPSRVARLSVAQGNVAFSPATEPDHWVSAVLNRPLFIGDRLWADNGARVELELGTAAIRAAERTSVTLLNLDDRLTQVEVAAGRVSVRVRALANNETFEIDTPNLAFVVTRPGLYTVDVDPEGQSTVIAVRDGRGEAYGEGVSYVVDRGQWYRFFGVGLDNEYGRMSAVDDFDRWVLSRDARHDRAMSARYVPRGTIGYADLDEYGTWTTVAEYGNVWVPRGVPADWAPYRDGHWAWIEPWGWTWVDAARWGFTPFHYGRWAFVQSRWCWVPGPVNVRPVYAPALVAFVGSADFAVNLPSGPVRSVGWFPLAPGEVYVPPYRVSRTYFTEVNVTNTRVSNVYVTNAYANPGVLRDARYRYREMPAALTAVPVNAFVDARPVARSLLPERFTATLVQRAPVTSAPAIAPARVSVVGQAPAVDARPPAPVLQRGVVARQAPPPAAPSYTPNQLNVNPGNIVDANPRGRARGDDRVRVIAPSQPSASQPSPDRPNGAPRGGLPGERPAPPAAATRQEAASPGARPVQSPPAARPEPAPPPTGRPEFVPPRERPATPAASGTPAAPPVSKTEPAPASPARPGVAPPPARPEGAPPPVRPEAAPPSGKPEVAPPTGKPEVPPRARLETPGAGRAAITEEPGNPGNPGNASRNQNSEGMARGRARAQASAVPRPEGRDAPAPTATPTTGSPGLPPAPAAGPTRLAPVPPPQAEAASGGDAVPARGERRRGAGNAPQARPPATAAEPSPTAPPPPAAPSGVAPPQAGAATPPPTSKRDLVEHPGRGRGGQTEEQSNKRGRDARPENSGEPPAASAPASGATPGDEPRGRRRGPPRRESE